MTRIEWTDVTWNPTTGCSHASPGCDHCYAERMSHRLAGMAGKAGAKYTGVTVATPYGGKFNGVLRTHVDALLLPLTWQKPRQVFVNSMSDLFHPAVPRAFIAQVFAVMALCPQHIFQVLTKRPERMAHTLRSSGVYQTFRERVSEVICDWANGDAPAGLLDLLLWDVDTGEFLPAHHLRGWSPYENDSLTPWPLPNVWLGASVEDQERAAQRVPHLLTVPAAVRFLSVEPMLGSVNLRPWLAAESALHWVILGGESGPGARPMEQAWAEDLVAQCRAAQVPVFVKQLGTVLGGKTHKDISTFPPALQVRDWPRLPGAEEDQP